MSQYCFCFMFWFFGQEACDLLAPQPGIKPVPPALEGRLNHWTAREVPTWVLSANFSVVTKPSLWILMSSLLRIHLKCPHNDFPQMLPDRMILGRILFCHILTVLPSFKFYFQRLPHWCTKKSLRCGSETFFSFK